MQSSLEQAIIEINKNISQLNTKVGASTPFLHETLKEHRGKKGKRYSVYKWDRLRDGLHANDDLSKKWAKILSNCFRINAEKEEEEEEGERSPKRSWKKLRSS